MRTLVTLAIAGLLLHATWRTGSAYKTYYEFRDELQQLARFAVDKSEGEVENRVLDIAAQLEVPLLRKDISVWRENDRTFIDAAYGTQIEILPTYQYPWEFNISVEAWSAAAPKASDFLAPR
ncbi:MAG: hypothetical protein ACRD3C_20465 [Vicinamibacterales bacterium]